jgi:uncharacterized protein (DUF2141 family)
MCGSGPFKLVSYDTVDEFWTMTRNTGYWRGWPANFPKMAGVGPKGYVNDIVENFGVAWATRCAHLVSGAADFAAIPRNHLDAVYTSPTPPFNPPTNYPKDGIRCTPNIPTLQVDAMFFTFDISQAGLYGPVNNPGVFTADGIPSDFFSNPTWGLHVRKGFAQVVDYVNLIQTGFNGEGQHAYTALIAGLPYYDPSVKGYDFNLTAARAEFAQVPGIQKYGFTIRILWNTGNLLRQTLANLITSGLAAVNSTFVGVPVELDWGTVFLPAILRGEAPTFCVGWLADFPDMHNFALPFYSGVGGTYPIWAGYDNATIDAQVTLGAQTPDGPERQQVYSDLARMVIQDCPSVTTVHPVGRHFERDSIVGWYYNSIYPGIYAYNLWKWYYIPQALHNPPTQPLSNQLGVDVNYDGVINFLDLSSVVNAWGALAGPPIDPEWFFRFDINNDRIINTKDAGLVDKYFGTGTPNPLHGGAIGLVAQPSKQNVSINYNVNITVAINSATNFSGYEVRILYDPNILTLSKYEVIPVPGWTDTMNVGFSKVIGSQNCTAVSLWLEGGTSFTGNTTLVIFTFKGLAKGETALDISTSTLATGWPMQETPYNYTNCNVTVTMTGDINGDGKVDMKDIGYAAYRFGTDPSKPLWNPNADIDGDNKITMMDIGIIAYHYNEIDP